MSSKNLVTSKVLRNKTVQIETKFEDLVANVDQIDSSKYTLVEPELVVKSTPQFKVFQGKEYTEALQKVLNKLNSQFIHQRE